MTLKDKAINSIIWSGVERFSVQSVQFIISLLIARVLLPSDYGLIAMLGIFIAIAQSFIDSGFSDALIQKQNRTQTDFSTVFYFNIAVSVIAYAALWLLAPFVALFYNEPQLELITRVISLNVIIGSFTIIQRARLTIELNFKLQALISLMAVTISGIIGIVMAYHSYGVWSLVVQVLLNNSLNTLLLWILARWTPSRCFSLDSFRTLFSFGSKLLLAGLLSTLYTNLYSLVIGKKYLATDLGYYNRAFSFTNVVSGNLITVITRVIYPIQCRLQDDDERLRCSFLGYIRMACYIIFPLMIGMFVLAKPLVLVLLTEKWLFSADLLQILCLAYMWEIVMRINVNILSVKGRTDYTLKSEIYKKIVAFTILFITLWSGLEIMCWGLVLYSWIDLFIITRYTKKILQVGLWMEVKTFFPVLLLSVGMGVVVWLSAFFLETSFLKLLIGFVSGVVFYISFSYLFRFPELHMIRDFVTKRKALV